MHRRLLHLVIISFCTSFLLTTLPYRQSVRAQSEQRCFEETGFCIAGRIREFWEQNGGLAVFGFPTTPQREESIEGQPFQVQWFERNRLELHPENTPPYDVLLGRLGVVALEQQQRDWWTFPRSEPQAGCRYFEETRQNICGEILSAWRANGLELDGQPGKSEAENLALFGLPISALQSETLSDGNSYEVQWFERARFEIHPQNEPPFRVLLGLLGNEVQAPSPQPTPAQSPTPDTATPQPQPTAPPAGGPLIAFHSQREGILDIYTMQPDGSGVTRLTDSRANYALPAWSPDGSKIAFTSDLAGGGNLEIYIMNADGSGITRVTDNPARDTRPTWSPDGTFIAFVSDRDGNEDIYVTTPDGSQIYRLTDESSNDSFPAWSPDGRRIAFASDRNRHYDIYSMNPDGSDKQRLTDNSGQDAYPAWSPDSARIVFASGRDGDFEIYVMDASGSTQTRLTQATGDDVDPSWSADGQLIAFQSDRDANKDVYVMNASGQDQRRLTDHPVRDESPRWSPAR